MIGLPIARGGLEYSFENKEVWPATAYPLINDEVFINKSESYDYIEYCLTYVSRAIKPNFSVLNAHLRTYYKTFIKKLENITVDNISNGTFTMNSIEI